jgi:WD40 repeat protein
LEVKQCIFVLLTQLSGLQDATVKDHALVVLQDLDLEGTTTSAATYPLKSRLLAPESSPLLIRAQKIQYLEHDLRRVRLQRLEEARLHIYIPPMAKANLQAPDEDLFLLMDNVQEFLSSDRQVMLILGDSGGGKSTFNKHLEAKLLRSYIIGGWIPLFINLPAIDRPVKELMTEQLKEHGFSEAQIQELKQHRRFIVICDGYDESQLTTNLHTTNLFNRPGQWKVKMVITCRTQYLGPNYRNRFMPQGGDHYDCPAPNLFDEAVIAPFSKEQIKSYVEQYVPLEPRPWVTEDYMDRLTAIPNLLDLVRNPFLLSLTLEALPGVTKDKQELSKIEITRVQLYDTFVDHWLGVNQRRLERNNALSKEDQDTLLDLIDDGFIRCGSEYLRRLAAAIFKEQEGNPVVQYTNRQDKASWKAAFFGTDPEIRLLRESSPLTRTGNQYRFFHRSMLEYFFSRVIYNPIKIDEKDLDSQRKTWTPTLPPLDANGPLFQMNLLVEPSIIQFLCDRVKLDQAFEQQLRAVIDQSKADATATTAATNAISILVRAGTLFNGADLRGIKIPGADLSGGQFDSAQFQEADLSRVNLSRSWLRQADMNGVQMEGVQFGEQPYLELITPVLACAYSPDGRMLAVGQSREEGPIVIYDTSFWTEIHRLIGTAEVHDVAFSPDSQTIVSGEGNGMVRLWDCTDGQEIFVMEGHCGSTTSVAFSPCGKQIASASNDRTVRLWDSHTGNNLFILEGHTDLISSVKYSPKGERLVSGGWDATIRFWDTVTGEPGMVLRSSLEDVLCVAYSPDGQWIVSAHREGGFQLWNSSTGEPGPMLYGHTGYVNGAEFSPNGQWIVSCSSDGTVKLWDALTGNLITSLDGHLVSVYDVAFSPDGLQIASGALDETVRLWDVESSWFSIDDQAQVGLPSTVTYSHDGRSVLAINRHCMIRKWDAETGACESVPFEFPDRRSINLMAFSSDGRQMITNCDDGSLRLYDSQTGAAEPVLKGYSKGMTELAYSPCRRWIAFADKRTVRLWDLHDTDQRVLHVDARRTTQSKIEALAFSPTGHQLAVGFSEGVVRVIDPKTQKAQFALHLENRGVAALSFSPSEKQLAIGTAIGLILWDFYQTTSALQLEGPSGYVYCLAYSPCGEWVASSCEVEFGFSTVLLWHLRSKEEEDDKEKESWSCVSVVGGFFQHVRELCWNPAVPMEFVTASHDGSIRVWRVSSDGKGGSVVVRMLWGTNLRMLCVAGLTFKDTTGLRPIYQKLLLQRGAIDG